MSLLVSAVLGPFAALALALAMWLFLETLAAMFSRRKTATYAARPVAVVMPAHNEAAILAATLSGLRTQLRPQDRLIVVADNCTDATAEIARSHDATVIERVDPARRGKGYALQFALDHLKSDPPEVVVFTDADCFFAPGALQRVASAAAMRNRPAQALYLMQASAEADPKQSVAAFAWLFMNGVRMRGLDRLADATRFTGAGLAAPWAAVRDIDLASGEIVEDLALTMTLARNGAAPFLVPDALVTSVFPDDEAARTRQAARWAIGSLRYGFNTAIAALVAGVVRGKWRQAALAFDLLIPPLTIFLALLAGLLAVAALAWGMTGVAWPFWLAALAFGLTLASLVLAWVRFGRAALPVSALGGVLAFLASKFLVFGAKGRASAKAWTPTRGGPEGKSE